MVIQWVVCKYIYIYIYIHNQPIDNGYLVCLKIVKNAGSINFIGIWPATKMAISSDIQPILQDVSCVKREYMNFHPSILEIDD